MPNDPCFRTVIVGVNGASGGRDAFHLVRRLALDVERLILVSVDLPDPLGLQMAGGAIRADAQRQAAEFAQRAQETSVEVVTRVRTAGRVADGLADEAQRSGANLIVVGCSQRGKARRVLLGDDTRDILHRAPCAVAVAPHGFAERSSDAITAIGVGFGTDGASESAAALAQRLKPSNGSLRLTQAVYPSPTAVKLLPYGITSDARERLAALEGFDERDVTFGSVRYGLLELAGRVDLLVIGLHRHSALGRLLHGSTADELLHDLPCPLLAVPEPPSPDGDPERVMAAAGRHHATS